MYRPGDPKAICDRCGFTHHLSELKKEWTGLMVCSPCWEPRHPQEFVRARADRQVVPNARPEPPDRFLCTQVYDPDVYIIDTYGCRPTTL